MFGTRTTGGRGAGLALAGASLGFGVVQLDVTVVNVAVTPIRAHLGASVSGAQWVVDAYTVTFAALIMSAGSLADRVGAKRLLIGGFLVFTLASVACGLAPSLVALVVFRAVQGVGAAALVPCSLAVLNHAYSSPDDRARAVGLWAAGASVGLSGGPLIGGVLTDLAGWRWIFLINFPLGLLGAILIGRFALETPRAQKAGTDWPGQILGIITLVALTAAIVQGGSRSFADPLVVTGLVVAATAGIAFVVVERRRPSPMLPLQLFGSPTFAAASAIGLSINIAFYGLIFVLGLWFQTVHDYSPLQTGLAFAPATAVVLTANLSATRLVKRLGSRVVVSGSSVVFAASLAGLLFADRSTPYPAVVTQLVLVGATLGLIVPAITTALLSSVDRERSGIAAGTLNTARQTGSVIGVAVFGTFAAHSVQAGLHHSLITAACLALLVAAFAIRLPAAQTA